MCTHTDTQVCTHMHTGTHMHISVHADALTHTTKMEKASTCHTDITHKHTISRIHPLPPNAQSTISTINPLPPKCTVSPLPVSLGQWLFRNVTHNQRIPLDAPPQGAGPYYIRPKHYVTIAHTFFQPSCIINPDTFTHNNQPPLKAPHSTLTFDPCSSTSCLELHTV